MQVQNFHRVRDIFQAALDRPPEERTAFVEELCGDDLELLVEIKRLLIAHDHDPDFLEQPAMRGKPIDLLVGQWDGRLIGAYEIQREIGRGGMGIVYDALRADDTFRKRVALKVVRPEASSDGVIRRFHQEREILASLDHPNIARLLDGGTTPDGLPYFVMEFVEGEPINRYCDERKLNITERLQLFRTVCSAVQFAHQNLVIHRDLKPGNILVTVEGTPKLLDFGIAKLVREHKSDQTVTRFTAAGVHPLTPEYASPEQILSRPITTATDIYSLGVVLYELLTGFRPYRLKELSLHEIAREVCEQEPMRPSAIVERPFQDKESSELISAEAASASREGKPARLKRRLSGDLDNIVLKALKKDPAQRYASVEQLSDDIRRHLEGLPITARNDTTVYRVRKFVRRHKIGVAAAMAVMAAMIGAVAVTRRQADLAAVQAREAHLQRDRAEEQKQVAGRQRQRAEYEAHRATLNSLEAETQKRIAEERARDAVVQSRRAEEKSREADTQRQTAERRFKYARDLASSLFSIFDEVKDLPGSKTARLLIADKAAEYIKLLADDGSDPSLRTQLAAAQALGRIYDSPKRPSQAISPRLMERWVLSGGNPTDYRTQVDTSVFHSGKASGCLYSVADASPSGFGTLMQGFSVGEYRGKRVRMSGYVKADDVEGWAGLWMRIDGEQPNLAFDNMQERPIKNSHDWGKYEVVLDVPQKGEEIVFGILLGGKGRVWLDDVQFESVGQEVTVTGKSIEQRRREQAANIPAKPANLDFEQ